MDPPLATVGTMTLREAVDVVAIGTLIVAAGLFLGGTCGCSGAFSAVDVDGGDASLVDVAQGVDVASVEGGELVDVVDAGRDVVQLVDAGEAGELDASEAGDVAHPDAADAGLCCELEAGGLASCPDPSGTWFCAGDVPCRACSSVGAACFWYTGTSSSDGVIVPCP
jgi:hypothetical protein